jgi:hypothetical protein
MRGGIQAEDGCVERFALKVLAQHRPLSLGSCKDLLPGRAVAVSAGRVVDKLTYCD